MLTLKLKKSEIKAYLNKFTREEVYGRIFTEWRDEKGGVFMNANHNADGAHIIPSTGLGFDDLAPV